MVYRIQVTQYGADTFRLQVKHKQTNTRGTPLPEPGSLHVEAQTGKEKKNGDKTRSQDQDHKIARDLYIKIKTPFEIHYRLQVLYSTRFSTGTKNPSTHDKSN